jgi:hypothetical protein
MSEPTQPGPEPAPAPEPASTPAPESAAPPSPPSDAPITAREAADLIAGKTDDAAPPQESRSETEAQEPQDESLEAPRSWPKKEREAFAALTPEHQEAFLARDRAREADIQLGLRQAAEQRKAAEALAQQAEQAQAQARWQYERRCRSGAVAGCRVSKEFGTPTWDDLQDWQRNDPLRYQAWTWHKRLTASAELQAQQTSNTSSSNCSSSSSCRTGVEGGGAVKFADKFPSGKTRKKYQANVPRSWIL